MRWKKHNSPPQYTKYFEIWNKSGIKPDAMNIRSVLLRFEEGTPYVHLLWKILGRRAAYVEVCGPPCAAVLDMNVCVCCDWPRPPSFGQGAWSSAKCFAVKIPLWTGQDSRAQTKFVTLRRLSEASWSETTPADSTGWYPASRCHPLAGESVGHEGFCFP